MDDLTWLITSNAQSLSKQQGTHHREQRGLQTRAAIVKQPLVEQGEQSIQDGTVSFKDFINESHLWRRRQIGIRCRDANQPSCKLCTFTSEKS